MYIADNCENKKVKDLEIKDYLELVDVSTIPEKPKRVSKYNDLVNEVKKLEGTQALKVVETKGVSLPAIASIMYKLGYKVTKRIVNKKNVLYISLKTE